MNNNEEILKQKIIKANNAYRKGESIISDSEYDELVEEFQRQHPNEYDSFRNSLNEGKIEFGTKIKHKYIMGSLDKIKNSDQETLSKFIKKHIKTELNISAKVDGISSVAYYKNGKLLSFASRGDGYVGMDYTDKSKYVKGLLQTIPNTNEFYIRGELVILNSEIIDTNTNYRNICAGYMNTKYWNKEDIKKVSFIPYTILGDKYTKKEQFKLLKEFGFNTAWHETINSNIDNLSEYLTEKAKLNHEYSCDGLVLIDDNSYNEIDEYRPKNSMAFKINELSAITRIIDIDWSSVSKDGYISPVFVLEPVEIGGAMISRASAANLDIIDKLGAKYGSVVKITKANDIIPHIDEVIDNSNTTDIEFPTECPCCGYKLERDRINLRCKNKKCQEQLLHQLAYFIKKLGVKHISEATLKNFNIYDINDLLKFQANPKYKLQMTLVEELKNHMFNKSKQELISAMNFKGVGEILINKIIDFYTLDKIENNINTAYTPNDFFGNSPANLNINILIELFGLPDGIGQITLQKFADDIVDNLDNANKIIKDIRYNYSESSSNNIVKSKKISNGMSICFTGKLNTMSRTEAEDKAKLFGFEIKGVSKNLTYLVTNDPNTNSGKGKKARELKTIKIISENEFLRMISNNSIDINNL